MKRLAILVLVMLAMPVQAGWLATNWPAWSTQDRGRQRAREVWTGVVERCNAAGVSLPAEPWWDTQRTRLKTFKTTIKNDLIPVYVDLSKTNSSGNFNSWFSNGVQTIPPFLTLTALCAMAEIPTNYFAYTPWDGLNGYGQYTTDVAAVGHPHGSTNSITVAGGSYFPSGRSVWYTTDYGWAPMKDILNVLSATRGTSAAESHEYYTNLYSNPDVLFYTNRSISTVIQKAIDVFDIVGGWGPAAFNDLNIEYIEVEIGTNWFSTGECAVTIEVPRDAQRGRTRISSIPTNSPHSAQVYTRFWIFGNVTNWLIHPDAPVLPVYQGATPDYDLYQLWESFSSATTNLRVGAVVSNNFFDLMPAAAEELGVLDLPSGNTTFSGIDDPVTVLFWQFDKSGP